MTRRLALLSVGLAYGLAACGQPPTPTLTPTPAPVLATSAEQILGTWQCLRGDRMFHQFREDGLYHVDYSLEDVGERPGAIAEYWFEGTTLLIRTIDTPSLPACDEPEASYTAELLENGNLRFRAVRETCHPRRTSTVGDHIRAD